LCAPGASEDPGKVKDANAGECFGHQSSLAIHSRASKAAARSIAHSKGIDINSFVRQSTKKIDPRKKYFFTG
jgi:hypothetical protein